MGFFDLFAAPKPAPVVIIRNILGEQIELVNTRDLAGQDLRGRNWSHAELSGLSLAGANREGIVLNRCAVAPDGFFSRPFAWR